MFLPGDISPAAVTYGPLLEELKDEVGALSPPIFERNAKMLTSLFPNIQVEVYESRQHLDPLHRAVPERFARALRGIWRRSGVASPSS